MRLRSIQLQQYSYSPFLHLTGRYIYPSGLATTSHSEEDVQIRETLVEVSLRDDIKRARVIQHVVIECELPTLVTMRHARLDGYRGMYSPWDEGHTFCFDGSPALFPDLCGDRLEILNGGLAGPICLNGFFDFAIRTYILCVRFRFDLDTISDTDQCEGNLEQLKQPC